MIDPANTSNSAQGGDSARQALRRGGSAGGGGQQAGGRIGSLTEDLQKLSHAVVALRLVHVAEEHVRHGPADERSETHHLAVDAMQHGFEVVALARVLGIEQLNQLKAHLLRDVPLRHLAFDVRADGVPQQELVHNLQVRPGRLQGGLVLLGVEVVARRRQSPENVGLLRPAKSSANGRQRCL